MLWQPFPCCNPLLEKQIALTYQRGPYGSGGQGVRDNDEEDRVAQQQGDLEGDPLSAVRRQIETNNVHHHQEDAGQQQVHSVEQWAAPDHHLGEKGDSHSDSRGEQGGLVRRGAGDPEVK